MTSAWPARSTSARRRASGARRVHAAATPANRMPPSVRAISLAPMARRASTKDAPPNRPRARGGPARARRRPARRAPAPAKHVAERRVVRDRLDVHRQRRPQRRRRQRRRAIAARDLQPEERHQRDADRIERQVGGAIARRPHAAYDGDGAKARRCGSVDTRRGNRRGWRWSPCRGSRPGRARPR